MRLIPLAIMACAAVPAAAVDHDEQLWLKLGATAPLSERTELQFEMNQRFGDAKDGLYESEYLGAVGVEIAEGVTLSGGVNRVIQRDDGRIDGKEWRPRQQVNFPIASIGKGELAGRVSLEQRFRSDSDDVGHRLLPEISYTLPLADKLKLKFAHESYFELNKTDFGQDPGHERMRNAAALLFSISQVVTAEVGYLNQYRFNRSGRDLMEHAATAALSLSF